MEAQPPGTMCSGSSDEAQGTVAASVPCDEAGAGGEDVWLESRAAPR